MNLFQRLPVGVQKFRENFEAMKPIKEFKNSIMNCTMIVPIKLYNLTILLYQESLKLTKKNPLLLWLLLGEDPELDFVKEPSASFCCLFV